MKERIIAHFDVDAFYVAVEREVNKELRNRPVAVSQYNPYGDLKTMSIHDPDRLVAYPQKHGSGGSNNNNNPNANGSLIAVSYEARAKNVKRNDRGKEAVQKCPELYIIQVPVKHGKADLTIYRETSQKLLKALAESVQKAAIDIYRQIDSYTPVDTARSNDETKTIAFPAQLTNIKVEKASVDEIYIDLSVPVRHIVSKLHEKLNMNNTNDDYLEIDDYQNNRKNNNNTDKMKLQLFYSLICESGAAIETTVGGLETSEAAIATNSLSKDDIRRGSSLQVLDSQSAIELDSGSQAWWNRTFNEWDDDEILLACGSALAAKARRTLVDIFEGVFTFSAGISSNKTMAKLASGLKKPNRQTLINPRDEMIQKLFHPLPIGRIRGLGGKFGEDVAQVLGVSTVGELAKVSLSTIRSSFPRQAEFIHNMAQGICDEEVTERTFSKSIGNSKTFRGPLSFSSDDYDSLKKWIVELCGEVTERLKADRKENSRYAKTLVVSIHWQNKKGHVSLSGPLPSSNSPTTEKSSELAFKLAKEIVSSSSSSATSNMRSSNSVIVGLGVSATNFAPIATGSGTIKDAFSRCSNNSITSKSRDTKPERHTFQDTKEKFKHKKTSLIKAAFQKHLSQPQRSETPSKDPSKAALCTHTSNTSPKASTSASQPDNNDNVPSRGKNATSENSVDPNVLDLSQLSPSLRAEIRIASALQQQPYKKKRNSSFNMKQFLVTKKKKKKDETTTASSNKEVRLKSDSSTSNASNNNMAISKENYLSMNKIDPKVLAELGPEMAESIMSELKASVAMQNSTVRGQKINSNATNSKNIRGRGRGRGRGSSNRGFATSKKKNSANTIGDFFGK